MRGLVLVLSLACASQGRRVQTPNQEKEAVPTTSLAKLLASKNAATAFQGPALGSRPLLTKRRADTSDVKMAGKIIKAFNGLKNDETFEYRELDVGQAPVKLLRRANELQLLTQLADAGLLSAAERSGLFSKLEAAGAFSKAEKLLPLVEKSGILGFAQFIIDVDYGAWAQLARWLFTLPLYFWLFGYCEAFYPLPTEPLDQAKCVILSIISITAGVILNFIMENVKILQDQVGGDRELF
mmetsp:Transcript_28155/g.51608  ORF Transcript_28155/g.51608 Transcript_28155/m.51608 type:complete len:240 (+) Transcript_28155:95-814(+)